MGVVLPLEKVIEVLAIALAQSGEEVTAIGSGGLAEGAGERDPAGGEGDDPAAAAGRVGLPANQVPGGQGVQL